MLPCDNPYYLSDCRCFDGAVELQMHKPDVLLGLNADSTIVYYPLSHLANQSNAAFEGLKQEIARLKEEVNELKREVSQQANLNVLKKKVIWNDQLGKRTVPVCTSEELLVCPPIDHHHHL